MCFAAVIVTIIVTVTNLGVVTMHHNKGTPKEIIVIEAIVWTFLLLFFGVSYLLV